MEQEEVNISLAVGKVYSERFELFFSLSFLPSLFSSCTKDPFSVQMWWKLKSGSSVYHKGWGHSIMGKSCSLLRKEGMRQPGIWIFWFMIVINMNCITIKGPYVQTQVWVILVGRNSFSHSCCWITCCRINTCTGCWFSVRQHVYIQSLIFWCFSDIYFKF